MRTRSVSYEIIGILIEYATLINIDIQEIFKTIHFNPDLLKHTSTRIPVNQYQTLWKKIVDKSKDKYFGLHFGESTNDFCRGNVLCAVMMNCININAAIQKFIRYHSILSDLIIPKLIEDGDYAYFTWDNNIPDITLDHHQNESNIIMLNSVLQCLSRATIDIIKIRFSHKQPDDITEHERIFNASLVFGCNRNEIALIHINKPDVSFYEVAFLLGFSEQSSFNHAFKRWTGSNPKEYKKKTNMFIL